MNEVEKLYRNCGIENYRLENFSGFVPDGYIIIEDENREGYVKEIVRDFTAEKQLELVKWLAIHKSSYGLQYFGKQWANCCEFEWESFEECSEDADFEQSLSGLINIIWKSLIEEERKQIKEILE